MLHKCVWAAALSNVEWNLALTGLAAKEHTAFQVQTTEDRNDANRSNTEQQRRQCGAAVCLLIVILI